MPGDSMKFLIMFLVLSQSLVYAAGGQDAAAGGGAGGGAAPAKPVHECECVICLNPITTEKRLVCSDGHELCADCVGGQVSSLLGNPSVLQELRNEGLKCPNVNSIGAGTATSCDKKHPFSSFGAVISPEMLGTLNQILERADAPPEAPSSPRAGTPPSDSDHEEDPEVTALRKKMEDAFILSCPAKCGTTAQEHDACCSVQCANKACGSYFCSLCYQNFGPTGSGPAHVHVREQHTGEDAFERRYDEFDELNEEGQKIRWSYEKRYHWLMTRKKLAAILTPEVNPAVKMEVLRSIEKTYSGDYNLMMWPMPAGQPTLEWLGQVAADKAMPLKKKIWLLQNEAVFLRESGNEAHADRIDGEVIKLGGKVMVSFDAQAGGAHAEAAAPVHHFFELVYVAPVPINLPYVNLRNYGADAEMHNAFRERPERYHPAAPVHRHIAMNDPAPAAMHVLYEELQRDHAALFAPAPVNPPIAIVMNDPANAAMHALYEELQRDHAAFFALGGEAGRIYRITDPAGRVPPFTLSDVAPNRMNHADAVQFCLAHGGRLPTKEEYEALGRAMGRGRPGGYDRNRIAGMDARWFWSGSVHPDNADGAFFFSGNFGSVASDYRDYADGSARCLVQ